LSSQAARSDDMTVTRSVERQRVDGFGRLDLGLHQAGDWYLLGPLPQRKTVGHSPRGSLPDGDAWNYLPHDHARSRAYRPARRDAGSERHELRRGVQR